MPSQSPSETSSQPKSPSSLPSSLFLSPKSPPPPPPAEPGTSSPTTELPPDGWSAGSAADSGPSDSVPSEGSNPPSNGELPKGSLASRKNLAEGIASGLETVMNMAHDHLADDEEQAFGLFLPVGKEVENLSDAAAGLVSRRVPEGIVGNSDLSDLVTLALVLGNYAYRQFSLKLAIRKARKLSAVVEMPSADDVAGYPAAA